MWPFERISKFSEYLKIILKNSYDGSQDNVARQIKHNHYADKNIKDITDKSTTSKSKTTCGITSEKYDVLKRHDC